MSLMPLPAVAALSAAVAAGMTIMPAVIPTSGEIIGSAHAPRHTAAIPRHAGTVTTRAIRVTPSDPMVRKPGGHFAVHVGNYCTGAVIASPSGSWVATARHCGNPGAIVVNGAVFNIVRVVAAAGDDVTGDMSLVKVSGNIQAATGGGFTIGTSPTAGSKINVYGFPTSSPTLAGCSNLTVAYNGASPEVSGCYLPGGVSGGPWFTSDNVLRGITSGLDQGGRTDYISNSIPFTSALQNWITTTIQG